MASKSELTKGSSENRNSLHKNNQLILMDA